jgi:hypothetical protein
VTGTLGAFETFEHRHLELEDAAVEEDQRAERLVLGRGRGVAPDREVVEEGGDLCGAHLARVTTVVKADELANPAEVRLLRARRVVESADRGRDGFEEGNEGAPSGARKGAVRGLVDRGVRRWRRGRTGDGARVGAVAGRAVRRLGRGGLTRAIDGNAAGGWHKRGLDSQSGDEQRPSKKQSAGHGQRTTSGDNGQRPMRTAA